MKYSDDNYGKVHQEMSTDCGLQEPFCVVVINVIIYRLAYKSVDKYASNEIIENEVE